MNYLLSFFNAFVNGGSALQTVLTLPLTFALGDFFFGVISAIKNGQFSLGKLADIFSHSSNLIRYVVAMLTFSVSTALLHWGVDVQTVAATIGSIVLLLSSGHSIWSNVMELLPPSVQPLAQELVTDVQAGVSDGLTNKMPVYPTDPTPWAPPAPRSPIAPPAQ